MTGDRPTEEAFDEITDESREIFEAKLDEYGPSLMVFRVPSLFDKLWIKAQRIRNLEELGDQRKVPEGRREEYLAIVNYSAVALMKVWYPERFPDTLPDAIATDRAEILAGYDDAIAESRELLVRKNHDYGEAWREMSITSLTDIIIDKVLRMKAQFDGEAAVADEDVASELVDVLVYAVFSIVKLDE